MAISADNVKKCLIDLASNPKSLEQFKVEPSAYLNGTNLSGDEKSLLLSGDPVQIRAAISDSTIAGDVVVVVVVVIAA